LKSKHSFLILAAAACGAGLAVSFFALFLQVLGGQTARVLLLLGGLWIVFSAAAYRIITRVIMPMLAERSLRARAVWAGVCLLAGALAIVVIPLPGERIHFLFPRHSLAVEPAPARNPASSGDLVEVRFLADGDHYTFPLDELQHGPGWVMGDEGWATASAQPEALTWTGSLLNRARLGFSTGPNAGVARVTWDGETQEIDLYTPNPTQLIIKQDGSGLPSRPFFSLALASYTLAFGFFFLGLSCWLVGLPLRSTAGTTYRGFLQYALPMIAVWLIFWLTFFPAVLSSDSIDQWRMIYGLKPISDWHPAVYTLLERLLAYLWNTPASAALAQILALSLTSAWGIGALVERGLPRAGAWGLSLLFALSPVNSVLVISLWKDIPYAISLLAVFIIGIKIVTSQGEWLTRRGHWVGLGLAGASTALFRHNGLAVVAGLLVILLLVYRRLWRQILLGAGLFLGVWWLVSGPIYTLAQVKRESGVLRDTILLHHFGAHVKAGTPLTDAERDYFNRLRPMGEWEYSCCKVDPLFFPIEFDRTLFAASSAQNMRFFVDLALRNPMVELEHTLCASSIVWRVCRECIFLDHKIEIVSGEVRWVSENELGLKESSLLPGLVKPLSAWEIFSISTRAAPWLWGPGLSLYVLIFCIAVYALRSRSWTVLLVGAVPGLQSLILAAVNIASDFRYQYGVYLIALLALGLVYLPPSKAASPVETRKTDPQG
jgi:hypothetical protein